MLWAAGVIGFVQPVAFGFAAGSPGDHDLGGAWRRDSAIVAALETPFFVRCGDGNDICYVARHGGLVAGITGRYLFLDLDAKGSAPPRTVQLTFPGAAPFQRVVEEDPRPAGGGRYVGSASSLWSTPASRSGRLRIMDVHPGIDLELFPNRAGFEYDLVVRPAVAAVDTIRLQFSGADKLALTDAGDLVLSVGGDSIVHRAPVAWKETAAGRVPVTARLRKVGIDEIDIVLDLPATDSNDTIVVDPAIEYAGFVGGSAAYGAEASDVDQAGNIYLAGTYRPTVGGFGDATAMGPYVAGGTGPYRPAVGGLGDATLTKLDPDGNILYTTLLGGSGDDMATGVSVAPDGGIYLTGITCSADFPVLDAAQPAYGGNCDAFLAKLDPAAGALVFSTYLGGSGSEAPYVGGLDGFPHPRVAADAVSNAHVVGATRSFDFPVLSPEYPSRVTTSTADAFYAAYGPDGAMLHSTLLGGSGDDAAYAVTVDSRGNAVVAGTTTSRDFPLLNSLRPAAAASNREGFVTAFAPDGSVIFSSLLGGSGDDEVYGAAADDYGSVYLAGYTRSPDFPRTGGLGESGAYSNAFLTRVDLAAPGPGPGSPLVPKIGSSVTFGGEYFDVARDVRVDRVTGDAYVTGYTFSSDFPVLASPLAVPVSNDEMFVAKFTEGGGLQYSVVLGGASYDYGLGIALTPAREAVVAGVSWSATFPGGSSGSVTSTSTNVSTGHAVIAKLGTPPPSCPLDIDGDGNRRPETDGLLLLRYMFGFRGPPLTAGALAAGATRTSPEDIAGFIGSHYYDVDGNGTHDPLTDGLMVVRHLFGLSGGPMTQGTLGNNARRGPSQVKKWLEQCDPP